MVKLSREQKWRAVSLGSAVLAALVVRGGIRVVWKAVADERPPLDPLREDGTWTDALVFSVATGMTVGLARLGARAVATAVLDRQERPHLPSWTR